MRNALRSRFSGAPKCQFGRSTSICSHALSCLVTLPFTTLCVVSQRKSSHFGANLTSQASSLACSGLAAHLFITDSTASKCSSGADCGMGLASFAFVPVLSLYSCPSYSRATGKINMLRSFSSLLVTPVRRASCTCGCSLMQNTCRWCQFGLSFSQDCSALVVAWSTRQKCQSDSWLENSTISETHITFSI